MHTLRERHISIRLFPSPFTEIQVKRYHSSSQADWRSLSVAITVASGCSSPVAMVVATEQAFGGDKPTARCALPSEAMP